MRAVLVREFGGPERLEPAQAPKPEIGERELLVRVRACGVCGHDVLARTGRLGGRLPRVLGHEIAGVVERTGAGVTRFAPGDRVVLNQRRACGACPACQSGHRNHCTAGAGFYGEDAPGGYAEYVVAGEGNAVALPDEISDVVAATLPCGVVTALHAIRRLGLGAGDTVAILGAGGGVGIHAVALARAGGARVVAVTHRESKLARLREVGAHVALAPPPEGIPAAVRAAAGAPVDAVVDCTGVTVDAGVRLLRHGGRLALLGNIDPGPLRVPAGLLILKEIDLLGSSHGTPQELRTAVAMVRDGRLTPIVAAVLPLAQAAEAHRLMERGDAVGRVVLADR